MTTERAREGREDGGPAFPSENDHQSGPHTYHYSGMTLRDWFAGQALAFLAHPARVGVSFEPEGDAAFAYAVADAMLKERDR